MTKFSSGGNHLVLLKKKKCLYVSVSGSGTEFPLTKQAFYAYHKISFLQKHRHCLTTEKHVFTIKQFVRSTQYYIALSRHLELDLLHFLLFFMLNFCFSTKQIECLVVFFHSIHSKLMETIAQISLVNFYSHILHTKPSH